MMNDDDDGKRDCNEQSTKRLNSNVGVTHVT